MSKSIIDDLISDLINNEAGQGWSDYSPDGIRYLLEKAGNPHCTLHAIHIAGTNGKGSTAHMLEKIFRSAGYTTGLYTSPHLRRYNERIRINNTEISDSDLYEFLLRMKTIAGNDPGIVLTFFDIMTATAFYYFNKMNVDIAIIETGLGGRLDSTNVIIPLCSIITSISYDHTSLLGNTLAEISSEKAGIIKQWVPVVSAACPDEVLKVIENKAGSLNSPTFIYGRDFISEAVSGAPDRKFRYRFRSSRELIILDNISLALKGDFQEENASLAITAAILLDNYYPQINSNILSNSLSDIYISGRMEILSDKPRVIFDPAHNPSAIESLIGYLGSAYQNCKPLIVLSVMSDKDSDSIIKLLIEYGSDVVYYDLDDQRALNAAEVIKRAYKIAGIAYNEAQLRELIDSRNPELIIFTGTFRLYSVAASIYSFNV